MINFKYRPEVDGLRAVAVVLVLLFHAGFGFTGGFVGVDVFFVISGFLITGLILKEQQAGTFQLSNFWVRRIRRILPASTFVVVATLAAAMFLFVPVDLEDLAGATIAQQLMASNFYFWQNTSYFDGPADLKPLLHTWSLAVEEQFYLIYPFLLFFTRRLSRRTLATTLITLAIASLALSEWGVRAFPSATFYLLPTRAWEMLLGGIICFAPAPTRLRDWQTNLLSGLGLAGIFAAGWLYGDATRFPGAAALIPCVATALIIYANTCKLTWTGRVLAAKPVVFVGLLSYSLYLWHWPILAFARYSLGETLTPKVGAAALAASFALAYLSWRFIETPFRKAKPATSRRKPYAVAVLSTVTMVVLAVVIIDQHGMEFRLPAEARKFTEPKLGWRSTTPVALRGELPGLGKEVSGEKLQPGEPIDFLIWGDSHALALGNFSDVLAKRHGLNGCIAAKAGTVPALGVWRASKDDDAVAWNDAVLAFIKSRQVPRVILVSRWAVNIEGRDEGKLDTLVIDDQSRGITPDQSQQALQRGLLRTVCQLHELGAQVWIVEQVPFLDEDPMKGLQLAALYGRELPKGVPLAKHHARQANVRQVFGAIDPRMVTFLDPASVCFDENGIAKIYDEEHSFYRDNNHLTNHGAEMLLGDLLEPLFAQIAYEKQHRTPPIRTADRDANGNR